LGDNHKTLQQNTMKSIIITRDTEYGVGRQVHWELENEFNRKEIILIANKKIPKLNNINIRQIICRAPGRFFVTKEPIFAIKSFFILKKLLKEEEIDLIYSHSSIIIPKTKIKKIRKFHGLHKQMSRIPMGGFIGKIIKSLHYFYQIFDLISFKQNDELVFVSKESMLSIKQKISKKKLIYKINNVDKKLFYEFSETKKNKLRKKYGFTKDQKILLYVGRLEPMKGVKILVEAINELKSKEIYLLIVGDGPEKQKYKNIPRIKIISNVNYDKMPELYNLSNLFILPSLYENCPMSLIEAKSCNTDCLIFNFAEAKHLQKKGDIFNNKEELKKKIIKRLYG
jgi:1,2-diacylglycerol 3-alpha-glucosyltransferase